MFSKTEIFRSKCEINVLHLSNCETKADLKNAAGVDKLDFAKKADLSNLKSVVDRLNIDK